MHSSANPAMPNNAPLQERFISFSDMLDDTLASPVTQETINRIIVDHGNMIYRIQNDRSATSHSKTVLGALTTYFANRIMKSEQMTQLFAGLAVSLFNDNENYLKYRDADAINDRYFIFVISFACNLFINSYINSQSLHCLKHLEAARLTLEVFLKDRNEQFDDCALVAKFLRTKLLYVYRFNLIDTLKGFKITSLDRPAFENLCNTHLASLKTKTPPLTLLDECFKHALQFYQFNVSYFATASLRKNKSDEADFSAIERQINMLTAPALLNFLKQYADAMTEQDMRSYSPRNLKLSLFSLLGEELDRLAVNTNNALSDLSTVIDLESAASSSRHHKLYRLFKLKYALIEWNIAFLTNTAVEACMRQTGYDERVDKLKHDLVIMKHSLNEIEQVKPPELSDEQVDLKKGEKPKPRKKKRGKSKKNPNTAAPSMPLTSEAAAKTPTLTPSTPVKSSPTSLKVIKDVWLDIPDDVTHITQTLRHAGYKVYIVGGAIRDMLLDTSINDYDLVTTAPMALIEDLFSNRGKIVGSRFPVFTFSSLSVQISPMVSTTDTSRPETLDMAEGILHFLYRTDDISEDSKHRDFTCNALYFDTDVNSLIDPVNGVEHTKQREIIFINPVVLALQKDPALIFRAIRLIGKYEMTLSPEAEKAICENAHLTKHMDPRRLQNEIEKTLQASTDTELMRSLLKRFNVFPRPTSTNGVRTVCGFFPAKTEYSAGESMRDARLTSENPCTLVLT